MNRRCARNIGLCLAGLVLVLSASAAAQDTSPSAIRIRTGFGAEYFNRLLT